MDFDFDDLEPKEFSFKYQGRELVLREATADTAVKYRNAIMKSTKLGVDGAPTSVDGIASADLVLLAGCLHERLPDGKLGSLHISFVQGLLNRAFKPLVEKAKEISGMEEKETEESLAKAVAKAQERLDKHRASLGKSREPSTPSTSA